jgi:hypothetical protein
MQAPSFPGANSHCWPTALQGAGVSCRDGAGREQAAVATIAKLATTHTVAALTSNRFRIALDATT